LVPAFLAICPIFRRLRNPRREDARRNRIDGRRKELNKKNGILKFLDAGESFLSRDGRRLREQITSKGRGKGIK